MINFLLTKGSITLHYEGKTKVIAQGDERFERVIAAIREKRDSDIPEIVEPELCFKAKGLDLVDGLVIVKGEAMPTELNDRIAAYQANGLPFVSLMKFWANLKKNPSFNSKQQLFKFLENKGHSITEDGCFIGYRGVRDDFKDKHSGQFDNSPGAICEMPRDMVDDNPSNTCSHGLHVGGYDYAKDFGSNGKLVMVKVNPADVVAVPSDYNGQKMRVCRFEVLKETTEFLQKHVVGADGNEDAELSDDEYYGNDEQPGYNDSESKEDADYSMECDEELPKLKKKDYSKNHNKRNKLGRFTKKAKKQIKKGLKKVKKQTKKSSKRK